MKIVKLNSAQFDKFATSHKYRNYFQSSMYGNVMSKFGYRSQYLGIVNEYNKLIGATLIIYKEVFMKNKIAYAPRGILFNYENKDSVLAQFLANQYQKFIDDINEHKLKSLTEQLTVYLIFSKRIQVLWKPCLMRDSKAVCLTCKRAI